MTKASGSHGTHWSSKDYEDELARIDEKYLQAKYTRLTREKRFYIGMFILKVLAVAFFLAMTGLGWYLFIWVALIGSDFWFYRTARNERNRVEMKLLSGEGGYD